MVFIPRYTVVEDQFNTYDAADANTGAFEAYSGMVVSYTGDELVAVVASGTTPQGFLMQNVKHSYPNLPAGFRFTGDLGSSDAFLGEPVAVAHGGGVADVNQYDDDLGGGISAGDNMYAKAGGKITNDVSLSVTGGDDPVAVSKVDVSADAIAGGKRLRIKILL